MIGWNIHTNIWLWLNGAHHNIRLWLAEIYTRTLDCDLSSANTTVIGSMSKKRNSNIWFWFFVQWINIDLNFFIYFSTSDTCTVKFLKQSSTAIRVRSKVTKILEIHFWTITQQQDRGEWIDLTTQASKDLFTLSKTWRTALVRNSQSLSISGLYFICMN